VKILYLNILKGCEEPDRFEKLVRFLREEKADVVGLSELYGWDKDNFKRLAHFKKAAGYKYDAFGFSENNRHLALFCNQPFQDTHVYSQGFHCAAVRSAVDFDGKKTVFFLAHLSPRSEDDRLAELGVLAEDFNTGAAQVFMGDLNSLSARDRYDAASLLAETKRLGLEKFGKNEIRTEVTAFLEQQGFVDAVSRMASGFEYSVPTDYNRDVAHFSQLRLDYIYVSGQAVAGLKNAQIFRNPATNELSDHFPVLAEIGLSESAVHGSR